MFANSWECFLCKSIKNETFTFKSSFSTGRIKVDMTCSATIKTMCVHVHVLVHYSNRGYYAKYKSQVEIL